MLIRKMLIVSVIILIYINLSFVCADENVTDFNESFANNNSFKDIQSLINEADDNDTIILNGNYYGNGSQINVNKSVIIEGINNATLDARGLSGIFNIQSTNVVIKNLKFINGNLEDHGAAIQWVGNNGTLINSVFYNNTGYYNESDSIIWTGTEGIIINSTFKHDYSYFMMVDLNKWKLIGFSCDKLFLSTSFIYDDKGYYIGLATVNFLPTLKVSNVSCFYGEEPVIKFKLFSKEFPWANENIVFKVSNMEFNLKTDANGECILKLPNNISNGNYIVKSECHDVFSGYVEYSYAKYAVTSISTIRISPIPVKLSVIKNNFYYDNKNYLQVKVVNTNSKLPLSNVKLLFEFRGKTYYAVSNSKGIAKFKIPKINMGNYDFKIKAIKNGTSNFYKQKLTIKKIPVLVKKKIKNKKITITLLNNNTKKPLKSFKINLKISTKHYVIKTNKKGIIILKLKKGWDTISFSAMNKNYKLNYRIKVKS